MKDISGFISKAAEKGGFIRDFYDESNIPTDPSNICFIVFFGDIRSLFILSSLLLHRYKEQDKPSKYLILASWPGFSFLFPYVNEYWSIQNEAHIKKLYPSASGFSNNNELVGHYIRNLNQYFFEDIVSGEDFSEYYNGGITEAFWLKYKQIKRFLPEIPSSAVLGKDFIRQFVNKGGYKVVIFPTMHAVLWENHRTKLVNAPKEFWTTLLTNLLKSSIVPVVCKTFNTYDLSGDFGQSCIYFSDYNVGKIVSLIRFAGCVVDMFGFGSQLATIARTPFIKCDERARYVGYKEYEIDDICGYEIPKKYIFSFSTILESGDQSSWELDIINIVINKINEFLPLIDKDKLPGINQSLEFISYDRVRKKKLKKIGTQFIRLPKDDLQWEEW